MLDAMRGGTSRVYLARHGRTAFNAEGRLRGLSDPPLDDVGLAEVARLAQVLAAKNPVAVISSPLHRAVATAEAIGSAAGAPVSTDIRLNDRDYGPMTGERRDEVERRYGSIDAAPGVEPLAVLAERSRAAFFELVAEQSGPVVLVSHDAFNRALLAQIDPALSDIGQRTGCWNQLSSAQLRRRRVAGGRLRCQTGVTDDPEAAQWIVRVVMSLCRTGIQLISGSALSPPQPVRRRAGALGWRAPPRAGTRALRLTQP
jgi:broad specificity phosphatase PhoE